MLPLDFTLFKGKMDFMKNDLKGKKKKKKKSFKGIKVGGDGKELI
jgi:hypothetical protein